MSHKPQPGTLQDTALRHFEEHNVPVTIFLVNGVRLQGIIATSDSYSLLLARGADSQLVYKSAISTMVPNERPNQIEERS